MLRLAAGVLLAVLLASLRITYRPATLCTLRALTGVPCPFCGGTTAAVEIGRGQVLAALRTSPLAVLGAPVVAALPLLRPYLDRVPARWRRGGVLAAVAGSEVWQLARLGLL